MYGAKNSSEQIDRQYFYGAKGIFGAIEMIYLLYSVKGSSTPIESNFCMVLEEPMALKSGYTYPKLYGA